MYPTVSSLSLDQSQEKRKMGISNFFGVVLFASVAQEAMSLSLLPALCSSRPRARQEISLSFALSRYWFPFPKNAEKNVRAQNKMPKKIPFLAYFWSLLIHIPQIYGSYRWIICYYTLFPKVATLTKLTTTSFQRFGDVCVVMPNNANIHIPLGHGVYYLSLH